MIGSIHGVGSAVSSVAMCRVVAIFCVLLLTAAGYAQPRAEVRIRPHPRYEPPTDNFGAPKQLETLLAEIGQTPAQAATRLDALLREHGASLTSLEGDDLISVSAWVENLSAADRAKITADYRKQFDASAKEALAALQQDPTAKCEDYYLLARRWPLATCAAGALVEAGDRAVQAGDPFAGSAYYQLARRAGWSPDETRAVTLAVCQYMAGETPTSPPPAAQKRIAQLESRITSYRGAVPVDGVWYGKHEAAGLAKYIPLASDGVIYLAGPKQILAVRETAQPVWSWSPVAFNRDYRPDRLPNTGRGATCIPAAAWGAAGLQIVVVRQPEGNSRDNCLRAFRAADGKLLWDTQSSRVLDDCSFVSNPAVAGRYVYAVGLVWVNDACTLTLVALDVLDGRVLWRCALGAMHVMPRVRDDDRRGWDNFWEQTAPMVAGDLVCITPNVGWAFAIGRFDGTLRWARQYIPHVDIDRRDVRRGGIRRGVPEAGERMPMPTSVPQLTRWNNTPQAVSIWSDAPILLGAPQDTPAAIAWDLRTGKKIWEDSEPVAPTLIGRVGDCAIYAGPYVHGVDAATGKTRWRFSPPVGTPVTGPPALVGQTIYVPVPGQYLVISAVDGAKVEPKAKVPNWRFVAATETGKRLLEESQTLKTFGLPAK